MSITENHCEHCLRLKARSADDCAKGYCPKWWEVRDLEAEDDCRLAKAYYDQYVRQGIIKP